MKSASVNGLPEILYHILLEQLAVRQRDDHLAARYRRHRFGGLKRIKTFLHDTIGHGGRIPGFTIP